MWIKSYSVTVPGVTPEKMWAIWSDMSLRTQWDIDTEWVKAEGAFAVGSVFYIKLKNGPKIKMQISECIQNRVFTDCYRWSCLGRLYGIHEVEPVPEGIKLTTTIRIQGPLGWVLRKAVGEKVVAELPVQTEALIRLARA